MLSGLEQNGGIAPLSCTRLFPDHWLELPHMTPLPLLLAAVEAQAAAPAKGSEELLLSVLVQLVLIIVASRVFAILFRALRQPAVVGEIAAGVILGPSCFGYLFPQASTAVFDPAVSPIFFTISQIGLILLLFVIGLEFDFSHLRWHGRAALSISLCGVAAPFALGLGLAVLLHPVLEPVHGAAVPFWGFALFMGISLSITAIPVLGRIMLELGITRTKIGAITIAAAAVDDACGWITLATISSVVQARFNPWVTLRMIALSAGFFLLMILIVRPALRWLVGRWRRKRGNELDANGLAIVLVTLFLCSIATNLIGIFAIFGAFLLGAILSDQVEFRDTMTRQLRNFLTVFFLPIFFTYTGLRTNIGALQTPLHWLLLLGVLACAIAGKLGGCGIAAWLGGFAKREAFCIGAMMNARGLMELIVINVGRELGIIPDSLFCMLVLMALITTMMTTPLLFWFSPGTELAPCIAKSGFFRASADEG